MVEMVVVVVLVDLWWWWRGWLCITDDGGVMLVVVVVLVMVTVVGGLKWTPKAQNILVFIGVVYYGCANIVLAPPYLNGWICCFQS